MIHRLILKNFKRIKSETFEFTNFDLIVGSNNSGKSTALQALAIWQYCVEQFRISKRKGSRGLQIVLPNFTALPLPEFNLLWTDKTDREYAEDPTKKSGKAQTFIYVEIDIYWKDAQGQERNFCVQLRYQSPQAAFAIPAGGWSNFEDLQHLPSFPSVVYVPPFSGLEPHEKWLDDGNVRQQIGKAQPGSVLRNLLYRVIDRPDTPIEKNEDWKEIVAKIKDWFGVELCPPAYEKGISTEIAQEYKMGKRSFDVISGGSGFHQILTLLAFIYGYPTASTILFDEPDAHLHVNLQRKIIEYFKTKSNKQFLIATHSEEFIRRVEIPFVLSILSGAPRRVSSNNEILNALSEVDNIDVVRTQSSPFILYLEGEDDERLLAAWAETLNKNELYQRFYPYILGGSTKTEMKKRADTHHKALRQINTKVQKVILLDRDSEEAALNPAANNLVLNEWKRKNIDNYLLVPTAWKRVVAQHFGEMADAPTVFSLPYYQIIDDFFESENLTLPPRASWKDVTANIFKVLDGKKLLFGNSDALFQRIKNWGAEGLTLNRSAVAAAMTEAEIHQDIVSFFDNLAKIIENAEA